MEGKLNETGYDLYHFCSRVMRFSEIRDSYSWLNGFSTEVYKQLLPDGLCDLSVAELGWAESFFGADISDTPWIAFP